MISENQIEQLFDQQVDQQRNKLLKLANRINPRLTMDDIAQPHDWPELQRDSQFQYEDGYLAGLIAAQISLRAEMRKK